MLRIGHKTALRLQSGSCKRILRSDRRLLSQEVPSSGSGLKFVGIIGGVTLLGCGGTIFYAKSNQNFRNSVENYIPGSRTIFDNLIGTRSHETITTSKPNLKAKPKKIESDPFEKPITKSKVEESIPAIQDGDVESTRDDINTLSSVLEKQENLALNILSDAAQINPYDEAAEDEVVNTAGLSEVEPSPNPELSLSEPTSEVIPTPDVAQEVLEPTPIVDVSEQQVSLAPSSDVSAIPVTQSSDSAVVDEENNDEDRFNFAASAAILEDLLSETSVACANAIVSNNNAANAIAFHSSLLRTALDDMQASADEKSLQWIDVAQALSQKERRTEEADSAYQKAIEELTKVKQVLEQTNDDDNDLNKTKLQVEQTCLNMSKDLEEAKSKIIRNETDARALSRYQQLIEETKTNLRDQISLPEAKVEEEWRRESKRLSQNEEMEILRHMQHRVEQLQHELSEEKSSSTERLERTISSIRAETEEQVKHEAEVKLEQALEENRLASQDKMADLERAHERELRNELKKQTAAHAEHLAEALAYMDKQSAIKYETVMKKEHDEQQKKYQEILEEQKAVYENKVQTMLDQHQSDLNVALATVAGIQTTIDGRAFVENESRKAQELSLACDSLMVSLKYGENGNPVPLKTEVETLKQVYADHPAIHTLTDMLPEEAAERGVYPEEIIRTSFQYVGKICRRLSLINETHNSLFIYFLSYLKSLLTVSYASSAPPSEINQSELDVFSIISYANYCVQHGDIEQAVRFVNQLQGEPRKVAEGWLKEALLFLETRQTIDALCTVSNAIVISAQLED